MSINHDLTLLLDRASGGDQEAASELFSSVYSELKQLAENQMRGESSSNTLQSTALVHEFWLRLAVSDSDANWKNRGHFFATAALAMRRILVDAARSRGRLKRGGNNAKFELRDEDNVFELDDDLLALDEALGLLAAHDEKKATLVNMRCFAGLTNAQAAEQLGISTATAERYWTYSKAWLRARIEG